MLTRATKSEIKPSINKYWKAYAKGSSYVNWKVPHKNHRDVQKWIEKYAPRMLNITNKSLDYEVND